MGIATIGDKSVEKIVENRTTNAGGVVAVPEVLARKPAVSPYTHVLFSLVGASEHSKTLVLG